jgi:ABC-type transporter Mla maintaining outer membrane lipid asymmetry ATPase subunit MlaF
MERFHLLKSKDMRPAHVSGSIRRVTCLIRAVILDPEVLLVDDPTVGLSRELQQLFADLLQELINKEILHTLFISSFEESFISQFAHTNLLLEGGQLFLSETNGKKVVHL